MKNILILIFSVFFFSSCISTINSKPDEAWDSIQDNNYERFKDFTISLDSVSSGEDLLVYIFTSEDSIELKNIENKININDLKYNIDSPMFFAFLLIAFSNVDVEINEFCKEHTPLLQKYNSVENENALFSYLLSYCYIKTQEYQKSLKYLSMANSKEKLYYYHDENKSVVFNYYLKKTKDEMFSYSTTIISVLFSTFHSLLFELSKEFENEKVKFKESDFNLIEDELFKMGIIMNEFSSTLLDKNLSLSVQRNFFDIKAKPELVSNLESERQNVRNLAKKLNNKHGKSSYLNYLKNLYKNGEYIALKNLPSE